MPFLKTIYATNGATLTYHRVVRATISVDSSSVQIQIASWMNEEDFISGSPAAWNSYEDRVVDAGMISAINALSIAEGILLNSTSIGDANETLQGAQAKKWSQVKAQRDSHEYAGVTFQEKVYDADADAQRRIIGGVVMSLVGLMEWAVENIHTVASQVQPYNILSPLPTFSLDWTAADNTITTFDAGLMMGLGAAVGAQTQSVHEIARQIRDEIEAQTTKEEVEAILDWPALPVI